jgi:hypothetical protein
MSQNAGKRERATRNTVYTNRKMDVAAIKSYNYI